MLTINTMWTAEADPIAESDEQAVIAAAQTGDADALARLFAAYLPLMRNAVSRATFLTPEDARQVAYLGFLAAVRDFNGETSPRIAGLLRAYVAQELAQAARDSGAQSIPATTVHRYRTIMRDAGGDVAAAERLAPSHEMTAETFRDVHRALAATADLDGLTTDPSATLPREYADTEDRVLVALAFAAVDDFEAQVCRMAYGFTDYGDPVSDAEIGYRLGNYGRMRIQRTRYRALDKMRAAVGALIEERN